MSPWFKRDSEKLSSSGKRDMPDGVWIKCNSCKEALFHKELEENAQVCPKCGYHFPISSGEYVRILLDEDSYSEQDADLRSTDPLKFKDSMAYSDRIVKYTKKSGLNDAIRCFSGTIEDRAVELAAMDFSFMGGSVGSVVGEKFSRAVSRAVEVPCPLISVSTSGGMRMQEGLFSLMQMAKVSAALVRLANLPQPFISIITNPTTGGTTASFAMLGDVNIAEPDALIGFAGPRVIKQTIGQDLPEGFQKSKFLLEHGFLDMIVERMEMRDTLINLLGLL
ncbi:acetyl-CoA carboxylase carboxyltransferase subunit beta [bacterium]|nr:acetyl-CoA carboxylase carboxyltransferase subunit beta [bacterium]